MGNHFLSPCYLWILVMPPLTLYTLLLTAKALAMALRYLRILSTVSLHPSITSLGWHDLTALFFDIHIFSDHFLHLHLNHPLAVSRNRVSFTVSLLGNVKADILSHPSLSPPTCLFSCSPLNLYLTPAGPLPQDFLSSLPLRILVTTYCPIEESFSNCPLAFSYSLFFTYYLENFILDWYHLWAFLLGSFWRKSVAFWIFIVINL